MGGAIGYGIGRQGRRLRARYAAYVAPSERTWKLTLSYDGTGFSGWQSQPGRATVQGVLERALTRIEGGPVQVAGSGRTDAGVHAVAQVSSCTMRNPIPPEGLLKALNRLLPAEIRVTAVCEAPSGFHARHAATAKTYEYRIHRGALCPPFAARYMYWHPYPLDEDAMRVAADRFTGKRNFQSFASENRSERDSTVRTVYSSELRREGDLLLYRVRGSGFLYRMVRNIVGTLLEVGRGNLGPGDIDRILEARDRSAAGPTAPARGLFLVSVEYPAPLGPPESGSEDGAPRTIPSAGP